MAHPTHKTKVLIVDDVESNLVAMSGILEELDVEIHSACSGNDALSLLLVHEFALILLDVQMPVMDGFETASLLRKSQRTQHIPIIFVSAHGNDIEHIFKGYQSGAVDYLAKPINPTILQSKVMVFLELHQQKSRLQASEARYRNLAEFATSVLHNVGNVINSMNIAGQQIKTNLQQPRKDRLLQVAEMLRENRNEVGYLCSDPQGRLLADYLERLGRDLDRNQQLNLNEIGGLSKHLSLMAEMISTQQDSAKNLSQGDSFDLVVTLKEALMINQGSISKYEVVVEINREQPLKINGSRTKLVHIFINLIKNGLEAMAHMDGQRRLLQVYINELAGGKAQVVITDNGHGIKSECQKNLFSHGFTTKQTGHGFGLHYCAQTIEEMGGTIQFKSDGEDKGTTFLLTLPRTI